MGFKMALPLNLVGDGLQRPKSVIECLQFKTQKQPFDAYGKLTNTF
jgi:hypothetical protein